MDLDGAGGYFRWTATTWDDVLELASKHGWKPMGTGPPKGTHKADWPGFYFGNDGQLIYAKDAQKLASFLEKALIEMHKSKLPENIEGTSKGWLYGSEGRRELRKFIRYCRKGSFRIF